MSAGDSNGSGEVAPRARVGLGAVVEAAIRTAADQGHAGVHTTDLLRRLLVGGGAAAEVLTRCGVHDLQAPSPGDDEGTAHRVAPELTPRARASARDANLEAARLGHEPDELHLLLALLHSRDARAAAGLSAGQAFTIRAAVFEVLGCDDPGALPSDIPPSTHAVPVARAKRRRGSGVAALLGAVAVIAFGVALLPWEPDASKRPSLVAADAPDATAAPHDEVNASTAAVSTAPPPPPPPPRPALVHVAYVIPVDGREQSWVAPAIRHELVEVRRWFERQTGGAGPRFARDSNGSVTVTLVRIGHTGDDIGRAGERGFDLVVEQARSALAASPRDIVLVYADILGPPDECGVGVGGDAAVLWMPTCQIYPKARSRFPYEATYLAAHELTHALGAVEECAPNATDGHVDDDPRDLLYTGGERDWENLVLDVNHDDYFGVASTTCRQISDSPAWQQAGAP